MKLHLIKFLKDLAEREQSPLISNRTTRSMTEEDDLIEILSAVMENTQDPDLIGKSPERFISRLKEGFFGTYDSCILRVTEIEGVIAGELIAVPTEKGLHIVSLGVIEEYRQWGIASQLLQDIEEIAISKGMKVLKIDVHSENEPAVKCYQKFGFIME